MPQLTPISSKQAKIFISGVSSQFTSISGGKYSREEVKYNDGNNGIEKTFAAMTTIEGLTLTKPYDPIADKEITAFINTQRLNGKPITITVNPVNADVQGTPIAGAGTITYSDCTLVGYTPAKWDRQSTGLAMIEMSFAVNSVPTYG